MEQFTQRKLERMYDEIFAGPWSVAEIAYRFGQHIQKPHSWLKPLAKRLFSQFPNRPSHIDEFTQVLSNDPAFRKRSTEGTLHAHYDVKYRPPGDVVPLHGWNVPRWKSLGELAEWLQLAPEQLDWYADVRSINDDAHDACLEHYRRRWVPKRGGKWRLIEAPKDRLKEIQRRLLHECLDAIPPHEASCGFRKSQSITTYANPHVAQTVVWRIDLKDFFPSIRASRVQATMKRIGYSQSVARCLTGLFTTTTPEAFFENRREERLLYRSRHLPQGAPTSPTIANLCAYRLDLRLSSLCATMSVRYTRYADDMAFSGGEVLRRAGSTFRRTVMQIIVEEGFNTNHAKSRWMLQSQRQQLTGIVVNVKPNIRRKDFDDLKAILTNCARYGFESQNRERHPDFVGYLRGKIAFVTQVHPARGEKLLLLFQKAVQSINTTSPD
jgi:RNA-directed DNA polymerase